MSPGRINEATFASTNLRWALLLEDHPNAERIYRVVPGEELGIPEGYGRDFSYVVCSIFIPGRQTAEGHKEMGKKGDPDDWKRLRTSALGSALKSAGYPDNLPDLKALLAWRKKVHELKGEIDAALDAAATDEPDEELDPEGADAATASPSGSGDVAPSVPAPSSGGGNQPESVPAPDPTRKERKQHTQREEARPTHEGSATHNLIEHSEAGAGNPQEGTPPASESPEDLLRKESIRQLIQRFNNLPITEKPKAMQLKRALKLSDWFAASDEVLAKLEAKVAELEAA